MRLDYGHKKTIQIILIRITLSKFTFRHVTVVQNGADWLSLPAMCWKGGGPGAGHAAPVLPTRVSPVPGVV